MQAGEGTIQLAHGGGGRLSQELIRELLIPALSGGTSSGTGQGSSGLHDAALLAHPGGTLAFTTDSYVVRPLLFAGGDIGRLAVCGSVNDLAMAGARPLALSLGLILEEGLPLATLQQIVASIRDTAAACGVPVLTGDTKVVERGKGDGLFINTSAIGSVAAGVRIEPAAVQPGDLVLVSGDLGRHGLAILAARNELGFRSSLDSDLAPLHGVVQELLAAALVPHCLRDLTRGGLAGAIDEIARDAGYRVELEEEAIPLHPAVAGACELLGLDPLTMACEGRMLVISPPQQAAATLALLQRHRCEAAVIGRVLEPINPEALLDQRHPVSLRSSLGVCRALDVGRGDQLPRIC